MSTTASFLAVVGLALASQCVISAEAAPNDDFLTVKPLQQVRPYQDVRFKDLSGMDLSLRPELPGTLWFNQKTIWPGHLAGGIDPERLLIDGMNPGLGVRKLHEQGLTGKGVNVAIID